MSAPDLTGADEILTSPPRGARERLPARREREHHQLSIGGHTVHMSIGFRPDGRPGELFLDMHKDGAPLRAMTTALARVVSLALQHGMPLAAVVQALADIRGEPHGMVAGHDTVDEATSIPDLVARVLAADFLPGGGA